VWLREVHHEDFFVCFVQHEGRKRAHWINEKVARNASRGSEKKGTFGGQAFYLLRYLGREASIVVADPFFFFLGCVVLPLVIELGGYLWLFSRSSLV
jgi:hypothetical protein